MRTLGRERRRERVTGTREGRDEVRRERRKRERSERQEREGGWRRDGRKEYGEEERVEGSGAYLHIPSYTVI